MNALLLEPGTWLIEQASLKRLLSIDGAAVKAAIEDGEYEGAGDGESRARIESGVAVLRIAGTMVNNPSFLSRMFGMIGYNDVQCEADKLAEDDAVTAVVLDIDSPGGTQAGVDDAAEAIDRLAARKPVVVYSGGMMASGAYYIQTAAIERYIGKAARVGSIGALAMGIDESEALSKAGLKPWFVAHPPGKARLQFGRKVTDEDLEPTKRINEQTYIDFRARVASGVGLTESQIDALDASVYRGEDAVSVGLVNGIGTLRGAIERASELASNRKAQPNSKPQQRNQTMPVTTNKAPAPTATVTSNNPDGSVKIAEIEVKPTEPKAESVAKTPTIATLAQIEAAVPTELPGRSDLILACMRDQATLADVGAKVVQSYAGLVKQRDASIATLQGEVATLKETIAKAQKAGTIAFNPNPLPEAKSDGPADKGAGAKAFITNVQAEMKAGKTQPDAILSVHASNPDLYKAWSDAGAPPIQHAA